MAKVILRPTDVKFPVKKIPSKFDNGETLANVLTDIKCRKLLLSELPNIKVVWDNKKWEWFTLNSRRLWLLQELEKSSHVSYVSMKRTETNDEDSPKKLYKSVELNTDGILSSKYGYSDEGNNSKRIHVSKKKTVKSVVTTTTVSTRTVREETEQQPPKLSSLRKSSSYNSLCSMNSLNSVSSSITRNQRVLSKASGLFGYGFYHAYKSEYLDKIKTSRKTAYKKYKPYNIEQRKMLRNSSSFFNSESSVYRRPRPSLPFNRKIRLYSDNISECSFSSNDCQEIVQFGEKNDSIKDNGVDFSSLYSLWCSRRDNYLMTQPSSLSICGRGYLCGMCYKKFDHIVDLQQHCEELMHFACITCGKFFSTYASLGQHCRSLVHKKD